MLISFSSFSVRHLAHEPGKCYMYINLHFLCLSPDTVAAQAVSPSLGLSFVIESMDNFCFSAPPRAGIVSATTQLEAAMATLTASRPMPKRAEIEEDEYPNEPQTLTKINHTVRSVLRII